MAISVPVRSTRLIFVEDFAEIIGRSSSAVRYMIHKGTAPRSAKIGGRRMFRESDVLAWIDAQFTTEEEGVSA
jgi:predicted DNA-binding transcriptional regulator AlpA